jgi:UMF1 family MFS transporter
MAPMAPVAPGSPAVAVVPPAPVVRVRDYWRRVRDFDDFVRLLACGFFYQAGIAVVIALAAVYADQAMSFSQVETMSLIFVVNVASALGAFGFGYLQDRIGHRAALGTTLVGWIVMSLLAALATNRATFWAAGALAGLCMGSSQSAGRAIVGLLAPTRRVAEFYGMWALAARLAAIVGPLTYGVVTWLTDNNHRLAIAVTGSFFVIGLIVLARIDIERGREVAASCHD